MSIGNTLMLHFSCKIINFLACVMRISYSFSVILSYVFKHNYDIRGLDLLNLNVIARICFVASTNFVLLGAVHKRRQNCKILSPLFRKKSALPQPPSLTVRSNTP